MYECRADEYIDNPATLVLTVQVSPDRYIREGNFFATEVSWGKYTAHVIVVLVSALMWLKRIRLPVKTLTVDLISIAAGILHTLHSSRDEYFYLAE